MYKCAVSQCDKVFKCLPVATGKKSIFDGPSICSGPFVPKSEPTLLKVGFESQTAKVHSQGLSLIFERLSAKKGVSGDFA